MLKLTKASRHGFAVLYLTSRYCLAWQFYADYHRGGQWRRQFGPNETAFLSNWPRVHKQMCSLPAKNMIRKHVNENSEIIYEQRIKRYLSYKTFLPILLLPTFLKLYAVNYCSGTWSRYKTLQCNLREPVKHWDRCMFAKQNVFICTCVHAWLWLCV